MNIFKKIKALYYKENLTMLAKLYKTDKTGSHYYTPHYQLHFQEFRTKPIHLLEIGIGGYENPKAGGESLRMWKRFFPKGNIYGIDIYDKKDFEEERIKIFQGSQIDKPFLNQLVLNIPALDIIIDDGSHINEHVIESFRILFPFLKNGGIYVIEDTQTSYWQNYGGDSNNLNNSKTLMCFFKSLIDGLNYKEGSIKKIV